jgi:hypothetical protein
MLAHEIATVGMRFIFTESSKADELICRKLGMLMP